jgi:membrane-associated HD superfamily phosphohydrolase
MYFNVSEEEARKAKAPHDLFLINLIFNHIFMFAAFLTASSLWKWVILVPIFSFIVLTYTIIRARYSLKNDSWYVMCHWQICAKRSWLFIGMISLMLLVVALILVVSGGHPKPQQIALAGIAILPTMITTFVLIIMETVSLDDSKNGRVPDAVVERFPDGKYAAIED